MCYAGGLLQLYSATGDTQWLDWSQQLQASLDELFWDDASGKPSHPRMLLLSPNPKRSRPTTPRMPFVEPKTSKTTTWIGGCMLLCRALQLYWAERCCRCCHLANQQYAMPFITLCSLYQQAAVHDKRLTAAVTCLLDIETSKTLEGKQARLT